EKIQLQIPKTRLHRSGNARSVLALFECSDGRWIQVHTGARGAFDRLLLAVGRGDLLLEEIPAVLDQAMADDIWDYLTTTFRTQPAQHWCDLLAGADVPCMPANSPGDYLWLDQAVANELVTVAPDGSRQLGKVAKYTRTPLGIQPGISLPGQHNT